MKRDYRLILAATPIGNLADASERLREVLASADVIAAEDTRRAKSLCSGLGITPKARFVSYYDQNEVGRVPELLAAVEAGQQVLVISDSGMPTVSDPGFRITEAAASAGIEFTVLPGPSAVTTALALSGLPTDRFTFEGFLPRKSGERKSYLEDLAALPHTMVFFESPHRLQDSLKDMAEVFGPDRSAAVCRELTKTFEEARRGALEALITSTPAEVLGEVTIVVAGFRRSIETDTTDVLAALDALVAAGVDRKAAQSEVMQRYGVSKRDLFDLQVSAKRGKAEK
ncbi:MAG: rRNA ((1402)-2-O)-methyltransferase [Actinomycetota bacterium]